MRICDQGQNYNLIKCNKLQNKVQPANRDVSMEERFDWQAIVSEDERAALTGSECEETH